MYVLDAEDFLKSLAAYQKESEVPKLISDYKKNYSLCNEKSVMALKEMGDEKLLELLDFWLDYSSKAESLDLFWSHFYFFRSELKKVRPRKRERRLF